MLWAFKGQIGGVVAPTSILTLMPDLTECRSFLARNHLHPKGIKPSIFQLIMVSHFKGLKEQTHTLTNIGTVALEN